MARKVEGVGVIKELADIPKFQITLKKDSWIYQVNMPSQISIKRGEDDQRVNDHALHRRTKISPNNGRRRSEKYGMYTIL